MPGGPWSGYEGGSGSGGFAKNPLWGSLLSMIPTIGPILGGAVNSLQSYIAIRNQNKYNSPMSQVGRLREAGLPMAAMTPAGAGNQSNLPQGAGGGIAEGSKNIGLYAATQAQQKQIELLTEEIRIRKKEADLKEQEVNYLLSGRGQDTAGTNLTANLASEQEYKAAQAGAQSLTEKLLDVEQQNQAFKLNLENKKLTTEIDKMLKDMNMVDEKIESENINQKIQNVLAKYQNKMSNAELGKLLKENGLISEHIHGARLDNAAKIINNRILEETASNIITQSDIDTALSYTLNAKALDEFKKSSSYNKLVAAGQSLFTDEKLSYTQTVQALEALIYTTLKDLSGSGGISGGLILGGIGGSAAQRAAGGGIKSKGSYQKQYNDLPTRKD